MELFIVNRVDEIGYDEYISMVVAAEGSEDAIMVAIENNILRAYGDEDGVPVSDETSLIPTHIGTANDSIGRTVIHTSYKHC